MNLKMKIKNKFQDPETRELLAFGTIFLGFAAAAVVVTKAAIKAENEMIENAKERGDLVLRVNENLIIVPRELR